MKTVAKLIVAVALVAVCASFTSCKGNGNDTPSLTTAH